MELTEELLEKAKNTKSVEELNEIVKAEGAFLPDGEAERIFSELHKHGELSDEELDNVAGGGCSDPDYKYEVGDWVIVEQYIQDLENYRERRSFVIEGRNYGRGGRIYWGIDTGEPYERAKFYEKWIVGLGQVWRPKQNKEQ